MKKLIALVLAMICVLTLAGCNNRNMNYIIANEPNITGIVKDTNDHSILIEQDNDEYLVSLKVENEDSMTEFSIGDEVVVYFDGNIAESYPMQINTVYAITLKTPAERTKNSKTQNEVLQFFVDKYDMMFTLWGPEGHDLYAFRIYADHAERECHILMPANTDDVSEYHKNLSWEVVDDELVITGEWQETFKIDISTETATSTTTGKVYKIYEMQPSLE